MSVFDSPDFNARLFFPRSDQSPTPNGARDVAVDGLHVRIYGVAPAGAPLLLLFHGNGEVVADYDDSAEQFAKAGVQLAVMDYPGYGASEGTPTIRAIIEAAPRVVDALRPTFVMGRSLGSACMIEVYGRAPTGVMAYILESGFVDLDAFVRRRGYEPWPLTADERAVFDPIPKLERGNAPLLVLHGERDTLIDPSNADRALAAAGSAIKRLVPGRGHNDVSLSQIYWRALADHVASV